MKKIKLSRGMSSKVDDSDFETLSKYYWHFSGKYAVCKKGTKTVSMHRFIMGARKNQVVLHINGNPLDNRRENLVVRAKKSPFGAVNTKNPVSASGYRGVYKCNVPNRWRAIFHGIYLGHFKTVLSAHRAYMRKAREKGVAL